MNNTRESIEDLDNVPPSKQAKSTSFQSKLYYNFIKQNIINVLAFCQQI